MESLIIQPCHSPFAQSVCLLIPPGVRLHPVLFSLWLIVNCDSDLSRLWKSSHSCHSQRNRNHLLLPCDLSILRQIIHWSTSPTSISNRTYLTLRLLNSQGKSTCKCPQHHTLMRCRWNFASLLSSACFMWYEYVKACCWPPYSNETLIIGQTQQKTTPQEQRNRRDSTDNVVYSQSTDVAYLWLFVTTNSRQ